MRPVSRVFWLKRRPPGRRRDANTLLAQRPFAAPRRPLRELFLDCYPEIRRELAAVRRPGVSLLAMDAFGLQAAAHLARKSDALNAAILGRHADAELALCADPALSLRHLALLVPPGSPDAPVTLRVLDLRTATGFSDERGREHRGLELDGPAFLACGDYAILAVPASGEGASRMPEDPLEAWAAFPEREYAHGFDAEKRLRWGLAGLLAARARRRRARPFTTMIRILPGPRDLHERLLRRDESPVGQLVVRSDRGSSVVSIGAAALRSGVLLGRAGRCAASPVLASPYICRVHLLVIAAAGHVYAVDTASRNGILGGGARQRALALDSGEALSLAGEASVEWRFVH